MYQNLQQLKAHSLEEIKAYKEDAIKLKAELEGLKAKGGRTVGSGVVAKIIK